jgi:hypothetical protein
MHHTCFSRRELPSLIEISHGRGLGIQAPGSLLRRSRVVVLIRGRTEETLSRVHEGREGSALGQINKNKLCKCFSPVCKVYKFRPSRTVIEINLQCCEAKYSSKALDVGQ